jgi:hypothetical protein
MTIQKLEFPQKNKYPCSSSFFDVGALVWNVIEVYN